jgi:hypothetical protein
VSAADVAPPDSSSPDLGRADELRVVAALRRIPDVEAWYAVVVELVVAPDDRLDEQPLLDLVAEAAASMGSSTIWTLDVERSFMGAGGETREARTDLRLDLVTPTPESHAGRARLEALAGGLRDLSPTTPRALPRDEALARACELVAVVWGVPATTVLVSDEEHRADPPGWIIGVVDPEQVRYEVVLGAVDGDPHVARLRRRRAAEVADSVGESG